MLTALTHRIIRRPRLVLAIWALLIALSVALALGVAGGGLFDRLRSGQPEIPGAPSQHGRELLRASDDTAQVTLAVHGIDVDDPELSAQLAQTLVPVRQELAELQGVTAVLDPLAVPEGFTDPAVATLVAQNRDGFLIIVDVAQAPGGTDPAGGHEAVEERLRQAAAELRDVSPEIHGVVSSPGLLTAAVVDQLRADLLTGEAIALPVSLVVMVLVFGGFLAAGLPLIGALASIATGMGFLLALTEFLTVDSVVVNIVTVLGLGLSIDYALLLVSRFREELAALPADGTGIRRRRRRGPDARVVTAVTRTVATAGRTVAVSAITIAIAVVVLMLFRPDILRAIGAAGAGVVLLALASALTLVPALLVIWGHRLERASVLQRIPGLRRIAGHLGQAPAEQGFFSRLADRVHRRPWLVIAATTAALAVLASPIAHLQLRNSTTDLLPQDSPQREFVSLLAQQYPAAASPAIVVVADAPIPTAESLSHRIAALTEVTEAVVTGATSDARHSVIAVEIADADPAGPVATSVVEQIRNLDGGVQTWVVGAAATQVDFLDAIRDGLPVVVPLVLLAIFVLLFLLTGSVLIPLKAVIVNIMGLAAALGLTVWVFQDGHLGELLGFTPVGGLEIYVVAVVIAFGFGLAMDYEVFLLARIYEFWQQGHDNDTAVARGLQASGRIITSAALVIVLVFLGFVAGELMIIKQVGFALAVTVAIDATFIRMLLVPATMTVLGRWNWWAPAGLRSWRRRLVRAD